MKNIMKKILINILCIVLIQPTTFAKAPLKNYTEDSMYYHPDELESLDEKLKEMAKKGFEYPETKELLSKVDKMLTHFEKGKLPQSIDDPYRLTKQSVILHNDGERVITLDKSENAELIPKVVFDFKNEVEVKLKDGFVVVEYKVENKLLMTQKMGGLKAIKITQDKELIYVLTSKGAIYALPKALLKVGLFAMPIPWVRTAQVSSRIMKSFQKSDYSSLEFRPMTRGTKPFDKNNIHEKAVYPQDGKGGLGLMNAGDLLLTRGEEVLGLYNRNAMNGRIGEGLKIVGAMANIILTNNDLYGKKAPAQDEGGGKIDLKLMERYSGLLNLKTETIDALSVNGKNYKFFSKNAPLKDVFNHGEMVEAYKKIMKVEKAQKLSESEVERMWRELYERKMEKEKKMGTKLKIGLWALAGLGTLTAVSYGVYLNRMGEAPLWSVAFLSMMAENIPGVLLDANYVWTNLKSSLSLVMLIPALTWAGTLLAKKMSLSANRALITTGLRIQAFRMTPNVVAFAYLGRQGRFLETFNMGENPFKKIAKNSSLGQSIGLEKDIRLGTNNYFSSKKSDDRKKLHRQQSEALQKIRQSKERRTAISWLLANYIVAKSNNMDPATLAYMFRHGMAVISKEEAQDPKFIKKWHKTAMEVYHSFKGLEKLSEKELNEIRPQDVLKHRAELEKLATSATSSAVRDRLRRGYRIVRHTLWSLNAHHETYNILKQVTANKNVADLSITSFKTDFSLSAFLSNYFGARANMANPTYLAADSQGAGFTTRPHNVDMLEQVFIYMVPAASRNILDYQGKGSDLITKAVNIDPTYNPLEFLTLQGSLKEESFLGSLKRWSQKVFNFPDMQYGRFLLKQQVNRLKMIKANLPLGVLLYGFAGLDPASATFTVIWFSYVWSTWAWAWIWTPFQKGNMVATNEIDMDYEKLKEARAKISQGLRQENGKMVFSGVSELEKIYAKYYRQVSGVSATMEREIQKKFSLSSTERREFKGLLEKNISVQAAFKKALESGKAEEISYQRERLLDLYINQGSIHSSKLEQMKDAKTFLEYSLANPPLGKEFNKSFLFYNLLIGAMVTTYYGTFMMSDSANVEKDALGRLLYYAPISAGIFAALYALDRFAFEPIGKMLKERAEVKRFIHDKRSLALKCGNVFL